MGFLNDLGDTLVKGKDTATRGGKALKLKADLAENASKRRDYCAQLGESVYEETKTNEDFRRTRESIYAMIDQLDAEKVELEAKIKEITDVDKEGDVAPDAATDAPTTASPVCPKCGAPYAAGDKFCTKCGTPL